MKKLSVLLLCLTMACALIACGNKEEKAEETTAAAEEAAVETEAADTEAVEKPESYGTIELGEYKGIEATKTIVKITEEDIDAEIQNGLAQYYLEVTDRPVQEGDTVNIDYEGKKDGVAFDGGTAQGASLTIGSDRFIDGFEDGLIGAEVGETRELNLTFPENYGSEELNGADVVFTVTVNAIQVQLDEPTDEWAEGYTQGECKTVDELRELLRTDMTRYYDQQSVEAAKSEILDKVVENSKIERNQAAIDYEYDQLYNYYVEYTLTYYGVDLDSYLANYGIEKEDFESDLQGFAEDSVNQKLIVDAIFDAEKMEITSEDEENLAIAYNAAAEDLKESYGEELYNENVKVYKVLKFLYDNGKITEVEEETEAETETAAE